MRVGNLFAASLLVASVATAQGATPTIELQPGIVISASARVEKQTLRIAPDIAHDSGLIVIRGDNITVDFGGATIEGMAPSDDPDLAGGFAILIDGGRNVRITNLRIRGYKVAILARGTQNLTVDHVDASNNWKPRLFSAVEHESLVDWLSFHHNENAEWLRFGAAFYLEGVRGGSLRANRAEQGMNALLMVRTDGVEITDNDFSFNSGLGIGLYRSSHNTITRNRVDFDVRGYSHGFYRRGQDSAGILAYEQSSDNVVAYNTATHGGDGFFLWAGQSTMDTGEGGANDNWLVGNDFSWAPANGIEATFSRNFFVGNLLEGNDYGIWGGYSFSSKVLGNCFLRNRVGVAVEHGQDNIIGHNSFAGDTTAISLWANAEPADWAYPKKRDTRSRVVQVDHNLFTRNRVSLRAANTSILAFTNNSVSATDSVLVLRDTSQYTGRPNEIRPGNRRSAGVRNGNFTAEQCGAQDAVTGVPPAIRTRAAKEGMHVAAQPLARRDRSAIVVDEWGPYDWKSPKLWPIDSVRATPLRLRVLGPPGPWRLTDKRGVAKVSREIGQVGDTVTVTPQRDSTGDWMIEMEYAGEATRTPLGQGFSAGMAYTFRYERFEPKQDWALKFFAWTDSTARDSTGDAATRAFAGTPVLTRRAPRLDLFSARQPIAELPPEKWGFEATSSVDLPAGTYTIRTISDDGVRVWVDDSLAVDNWKPHGSEVDHAVITGGRHQLRVQYYQVDGWMELRLDVVRGVEKSKGSAGPH